MSFEDSMRAILKEALEPVIEELRALRGATVGRPTKGKGSRGTAPDAKLLDLESAARVLSVSSALLRQFIRKGRLKSVRMGRRVLLARADLDQLLINGIDS